MNVHKLWTDDRAVSPVVGVALLIAITVILAAVIGGVVLGLGTGGVDTPQAQLQLAENESGNYVLAHNGGEPLEAGNIVIGIDGDNSYELEGDLTAGNSVVIVDDVTEDPVDEADVDNEVVVLWEDPNSSSTTVLERFAV